jgi:hypothetical protein
MPPKSAPKPAAAGAVKKAAPTKLTKAMAKGKRGKAAAATIDYGVGRVKKRQADLKGDIIPKPKAKRSAAVAVAVAAAAVADPSLSELEAALEETRQEPEAAEVAADDAGLADPDLDTAAQAPAKELKLDAATETKLQTAVAKVSQGDIVDHGPCTGEGGGGAHAHAAIV